MGLKTPENKAQGFSLGYLFVDDTCALKGRERSATPADGLPFKPPSPEPEQPKAKALGTRPSRNHSGLRKRANPGLPSSG